MELSPQTWRVLGLSVAAGYLGLGTIYTISPPNAAKDIFNLWPASSALPLTEKPATGDKDYPGPQPEDAVSMSMLLIAARDLSIGASLVAFDYYRMPKAMGILISGGMILCAVDVYIVWKQKGPKAGIPILAGASMWCAIGAGLLLNN